MMNPDYKTLCQKTCEIARMAGKFIAGERLIFDENKIEYKGIHDLVSYVDKNAEIEIVNSLSILLPEAGFIAEEGTSSKQADRFNWIIDPLDGTTNFIQGVPVYAVSIALKEYDEIVVGVVYEICRDECFYAWKNGGAFLNGQPIHTSHRNDLHESLLATGFPYSDFHAIDSYLEFLKWAMMSARGVRRLGSAATDMAYVACGRFDAFWEYDLKPWDVAAGAIIVSEAGGKVMDYKGGNNFLFGREIVATNAFLHETILMKISEHI